MKRISLLFSMLLALLCFANSGGCKQTGVGDPCVPEQEYDPKFAGFVEEQVSVESKSFQCQTRLCLVNHFRGRVSCPYGQEADGTAPDGAKDPCYVPGSKTTVESPKDSDGKGKRLPPQCVERKADVAVYCSCRCANVDGKTPPEEGVFCTCPEGFSCKQLVSSIGAQDTGLTGAYCVKDRTEYDSNKGCDTDCNAAEGNCGTDQGVTAKK